MGSFDGLVAVVTGGSSGIGLATALKLVGQGARVAVLDVSPPVGDVPLLYVAADVTDDASVVAAIATVAQQFGGIDVVVNNGGIGAQGAVLSLTLAMAADHVREGIRVNAVNPGTADTPWVGRLLDKAADPQAERSALEARQPMGRLVSADEVAGAIVYLASPESGATTGTALAVDGGMAGLRLRPRS